MGAVIEYDRALRMFTAPTDSLVETLRDLQHERCSYRTRDGDGKTCDCKFGWTPDVSPHSEANGCPELRQAIRALTSAAETAEENAALRKSLGKAWSAWLELAFQQQLDDGTPVLQLVLQSDPELRARLRTALGMDAQ